MRDILFRGKRVDRCGVVDNIHDNPELLEGEK